MCKKFYILFSNNLLYSYVTRSAGNRPDVVGHAGEGGHRGAAEGEEEEHGEVDAGVRRQRHELRGRSHSGLPRTRRTRVRARAGQFKFFTLFY